MLITTAFHLYPINGYLAKDDGDHLESRTTSQTRSQKQPHKYGVKGDEITGACARQGKEQQGTENRHKNKVDQRHPHAAELIGNSTTNRPRDGTDKWAKERQAQNIHIRELGFCQHGKTRRKTDKRTEGGKVKQAQQPEMQAL